MAMNGIGQIELNGNRFELIKIPFEFGTYRERRVKVRTGVDCMPDIQAAVGSIHAEISAELAATIDGNPGRRIVYACSKFIEAVELELANDIEIVVSERGAFLVRHDQPGGRILLNEIWPAHLQQVKIEENFFRHEPEPVIIRPPNPDQLTAPPINWGLGSLADAYGPQAHAVEDRVNVFVDRMNAAGGYAEVMPNGDVYAVDPSVVKTIVEDTGTLPVVPFVRMEA